MGSIKSEIGRTSIDEKVCMKLWAVILFALTAC